MFGDIVTPNTSTEEWEELEMLKIGITFALVMTLFCTPAVAQGLFATGFEPPAYVAGNSVNGVDGWAVVSGQPAQAVVQTAYVHSGSQALGIQQPPTGGTSAVALVRDFPTWSSGILVVEYWAMPGDNTDATGVWIAVEQDRSTSKRSALFGFRSGVFAYNNGAGWVNSTVAYNLGEWYKLTGVLNYNTRKWDFYVNGSLFASNLGFYHTAHTAANNIRFYKGSANLGMAVDDLQIIPEPSSMLALASGILGLVGCIRRRS